MLPSSDQLLHRLAETKTIAVGATSYNKRQHTVEAVISTGSPVKRAYGTEMLRISPQAVDLSRLEQGGIPLLDHHNQGGIDQVLGRLVDAWFDSGALLGTFKFAQTKQGQKAEGMIARGEITGVSAGYRVDQWVVTDADGDIVDERDVRWDDNLTFTATRWQLFEASLVGVPADGMSMIRSLADRNDLTSVHARMRARHNIVLRNARIL